MKSMNEQLKDLVEDFPEPQDYKMERKLHYLERMAGFYSRKIEIAPYRQGIQFKSFVGALVYAMETIKKYRKLTKAISELTK